MREASEEKKRRGEKSWGQKSRAAPSQGHSPSCLESLCLWRPVQPTPSKEPSNPAFFQSPRSPSADCCGGGFRYRLAPWPGCSREKADCARRRRLKQRARPPARLPRARVFCPRAGWNQPNRKRARGGPSGQRRGAGASSATATGARAGEARRASLTDRPEPGPTQSAKPIPARPLLQAEDGRRGASPLRLL